MRRRARLRRPRRQPAPPRTLLLLALRRDQHDVPRQAEAPHRPDHPAAGVELPPAQAVQRRAREGVVVVVPGLAERGQREPEDVGRLVLRAEAPAAEEVADRVDRRRSRGARGRSAPAPPRTAPSAPPTSVAGEPQPAGTGSPGRAIDPAGRTSRCIHPHAAILDQVGRVRLRLLAGGVVEQPAHVRVPEPAQRPAEAVAVAVRAVRVAFVRRVRRGACGGPTTQPITGP